MKNVEFVLGEADGEVVGKAVTYNRLGGVDANEIVNRRVRRPGARESRIKVKAAAINPTDILLREKGPAGATEFPEVPGMDAAGIVESPGSQVTGFAVGDEVMAIANPRRPDGGAQASYIVVPANSVARIPARTSLTEAATVPLNALRASH